jgi:Holliday junction resolvase RusA-like endonuclease
MITLTVYGTPVPKGSAKAFAIPGKDGARPRAVVVSDNKVKLKHWQTQIANEAQSIRATSIRSGTPVPAFDGPMNVTVEFFFNRPKSISRQTRPFPVVKPDLDKLIRAVLDGLTSVVWRDDAQVISLEAKKFYLNEPGSEYAQITIDGKVGVAP